MRILYIFISTLLLISTHSLAQDFTIGKYHTFKSEILKQNRTIIVHTPPGYNSSTQRYPVLYLLDGENHFTKTVGILDFLSRTAGNELVPQMIVVAIIHHNREQELIPPFYDTSLPFQDPFSSFLEKELIPYVDAQYPTAPYRVLVGHSLGGLRVVNTSIYQPSLFHAAIAIDPSLGHVRHWVDKAITHFSKSTYTNRSLYIAMGMTMPPGTDTTLIFRDTSSNARHMRSIMKFAYSASQKTQNGLSFSWQYYPQESHQSVVFNGTYHGLTSIFSWYKNEKLYDIFKPEVNEKNAVHIITDYYNRLSQKMGYPMLPPEQGTAELIDYLIFKKWYHKAYAFALLNAQNYPESKRAAAQLQSVKWLQKKPISALLSNHSVSAAASTCQKQATLPDPEYNISEEAINTLGYDLLAQNKIADAAVFFKLNVDLYPQSYNVYDSYGECLLLLGKKEEGIKAYKRSLQLNPNNTNAQNIIATQQH